MTALVRRATADGAELLAPRLDCHRALHGHGPDTPYRGLGWIEFESLRFHLPMRAQVSLPA